MVAVDTLQLTLDLSQFIKLPCHGFKFCREKADASPGAKNGKDGSIGKIRCYLSSSNIHPTFVQMASLSGGHYSNVCEA